jgi:hypothetical protein
MIEVCEVKAAPDHLLHLVFNTGEKRYFNMKPYLVYPVFKRLQNPAFFSLALPITHKEGWTIRFMPCTVAVWKLKTKSNGRFLVPRPLPVFAG